MRIQKKKKKTIIEFPNWNKITRKFKKRAQTRQIYINQIEIEEIFKNDLRKYLQWLIEQNYSEGSEIEFWFFMKVLGAIPEVVLSMSNKKIQLVGQNYDTKKNNNIWNWCDIIVQNKNKKRYLELKAQDTWLWEVYWLHKQLPFDVVAKMQKVFKENNNINPNDYSITYVHISSLKMLDVLMWKKVTYEDAEKIALKLQKLLGKDLLEQYFKRQNKRKRRAQNYSMWSDMSYGRKKFIKDIKKSIKKRENNFSKTQEHNVKELEITYFFNADLTINNIINDKYFFAVNWNVKSSQVKADFYGYILNNSYWFKRPFKHTDKGRYKKVLNKKEIKQKLKEIGWNCYW